MIACLRSHAAPQAGLAAIPGGVDWERLLALSLEQCVLPAVHAALAPAADSIPAQAWQRIHNVFMSVTARNVARTAELTRLVGRLQERGIAVMALRGPVLAEELYGDTAMRQFEDLDLLVKRTDAIAAMRALEAEGFRPQEAFSGRQEEALVRFRTERNYYRGAERLWVDLHWELLPAPFAVERDPGVLWVRAQTVTVQGAAIKTLSGEDSFLFLCVHGAKHGWDKAGRAADVAAWLRKNPRADWTSILERAGKAGKRRAVQVAVGLANRLLGAPVPEAARGDQAVERLVDEAIARLEGRERGKGRQRGDWAFALGVLERVRDKAVFVCGLLAPTGSEIRVLALPRPLSFVYYPVRWLRLVWKYTAGQLATKRRKNIVGPVE